MLDQPVQPSLSALESYRQALIALEQEAQLRRCRTVEPLLQPEDTSLSFDSPALVRVNGQEAVNFSGNDYLGLSHDARLKTAAIRAIEQYGTGTGASRLVSGTNPLVITLEAELARFKQTEAALVFNSGYQANISILPALLKLGDWVFADRLNHASLVDGCLLSGARWTRYAHLDLENLETRLKKVPQSARKWIVTDSAFSMDGDYPDLVALCDLAERYGALVMVDEAHATGLYGERHSSGLCEHFGVSHRVALQMGTFSKALGGSGAYVAGSRVLIDTLINRARGFIYSTALPPAVLASAQAAIALVQDDPHPKANLWRNVAHFEQLARAVQLFREGPDHLLQPLHSPIIPIPIGKSGAALEVSQALLDAGYFVQAIRPPTVPAGTDRLRLALSAIHTPSQIEGLVQALSQIMPAR